MNASHRRHHVNITMTHIFNVFLTCIVVSCCDSPNNILTTTVNHLVKQLLIRVIIIMDDYLFLLFITLLSC